MKLFNCNIVGECKSCKEEPETFEPMRMIVRIWLHLSMRLICLCFLTGWLTVNSASAEDIFPYMDGAAKVHRLSGDDQFSLLPVIHRLKMRKDRKEAVAEASMAIPSVRDCLDESEKHESQPDLTQFRWPFPPGTTRRNKVAANLVCLLRVSESYNNPKSYISWTKSQPFTSTHVLKVAAARNDQYQILVSSTLLADRSGEIVLLPQDDSQKIKKNHNYYVHTISMKYLINASGHHSPRNVSISTKYK